MKKYIAIILITFLLPLKVLACPSYKMVVEGELSPCNGLFLNEAANEQVKTDLRDNELRKRQLELKDLQIVEITKDREGWKTEAGKQAKLNHSKDSDLRNGILLGVLSTIAIMFASQKISK